MTLRNFIDEFMDETTTVNVFDDYFCDLETQSYVGRVKNLIFNQEKYEEMLNRRVIKINVNRKGQMLILIAKGDET